MKKLIVGKRYRIKPNLTGYREDFIEPFKNGQTQICTFFEFCPSVNDKQYYCYIMFEGHDKTERDHWMHKIEELDIFELVDKLVQEEMEI